MDPSDAFGTFAQRKQLPSGQFFDFLAKEDLKCALIAVFGFKFPAHDLEMCLDRFGENVVFSEVGRENDVTMGVPYGNSTNFNNFSNSSSKNLEPIPVMLKSGFEALVDERKSL